MPRVQDIHLSDETVYNIFLDYWNNGEYNNALNILNTYSSQLTSKILQAEIFNSIASTIVDLENNTATPWDKDAIQVVTTLPATATTGQVFFQKEAPPAVEIIMPSLITNTYNYEEGMTWAQFVASDYNTDSFYTVRVATGRAVAYDEGSMTYYLYRAGTSLGIRSAGVVSGRYAFQNTAPSSWET